MIRKRGIDLVVFQSIALKLGYWNRLNIMKERKSNNGGKTKRQLPRRCSPSASQRRNNVIEAIRPAAAGKGKPCKEFWWLGPSCFAAAEFKWARRSAPHRRETNSIIPHA